MQAFIRLRYGYPLSGEGYTCVSLSVQTKTAEAIFALCYLKSGSVEYVCTSPTFESMDGEYRHRFVQYSAFEKGYEILEKPLSEFESKLLTLIADGTIVINSRIYPQEASEGAGKVLNDLRLPVRLLVVMLVLDSWRTQQVHTISDYGLVIRDIEAKWPDLAVRSLEMGTSKAITMFTKGGEGSLRVECGQKLMPLMLRHVMSPSDISFAPWRETYARQTASNLVINGVTPSVCLDNQWTYIEGADDGLFENRSMENKFRRGKVTEESVGQLRAARSTIAPEVDDSFAASSYDSHVYEAIEIAQSFLLTSDVALCSTMEHTRDTMASLSRIIARAEFVIPQWSALIESVDHLAKFCFDILYGCHCLHTRADMAQGDLHGNNFTMHQFTNVFSYASLELGKREFKQVVDNPVAAYVAGGRGEADTYVFPYTGLVGTIIDFSRAIFGPGMNGVISKEFGADFARNFYRDQIPRALRALHRYVPAFVEKNQEAVKAAFLSDFETAFRVFSYVDFVAAGGAVVHALTEYSPLETDKREYKPTKQCIDFAKHIERRSRERLVIALHDMLAKKRTGPIPFAGEVLLADLFSQYKYSPSRADLKNATLCDVYNYNAPMLWDGRDYETFPPWARLDKIEEKLGGVKISDVLGRGMQPFLDALLPNPHVDVIAETVRAEQDSLDRPAAATSSWIEQ